MKFFAIAALALFAIASVAAADEACDVCEMVVGFVEKVPNAAEYEEELLDELYKACGLLKPPTSSECNVTVNLIIGPVIQELEGGASPDSVCSSAPLKFCPANTTQEVADPDVDVCSLCELLLGFAEKELANNKTETEILNALENDVCPLFGSYKAECQSVVATYMPEAIQALLNDFPPNVACADIKLCHSGEQAPKYAPKAPEDTPCDICELLIGTIEKWVSQNKTEDEIIDELNRLCSYLGKEAGTCEALVSQYGPELIQLIVNKEPASTVCTQVGLCSSTATPVEMRGDAPHAPKRHHGKRHGGHKKGERAHGHKKRN